MKTNKRVLDKEELNLVTLAMNYSDEDKARELFEQIRWPDGPVCPHCKNHKEKAIYKITPKADSKTPTRKGVYKCGACRKKFSAMVGTIFSDSHIPISKWLMAFALMSSSKKGMSAHQIHRMLGITYKTAWFMCHRIRFAMDKGPLAEMLKGEVEVDETYVGGKTEISRPNKTPVVALVERKGSVRTKVVANVTQKNLKQCLNECVSKNAVVHTDQSPVYPFATQGFKKHYAVNHSAFEYARKEDGTVAHCNTAESFFSLLKRGVMGSFHHVSREHLSRYATEFEFRWNNRNINDGQRMEVAIEQSEGKRLTWKQCV